MFNGIIKNTGKISKILRNKNNCSIQIISNLKINRNEIGSSISCSGVCLTLESYKKKVCKFYVSKETRNKSIFKRLNVGNIVNLEKSLKLGERISGHFVQGHVDTTSYVFDIKFIGKSWVVTFKLPSKFNKLVVEKGSITINGVSLTISKILKGSFQISIVPHTLKLTNLIFLKKNDYVNIEFDVLGKYINNFLK